jgi:hypothetical protein
MNRTLPRFLPLQLQDDHPYHVDLTILLASFPQSMVSNSITSHTILYNTRMETQQQQYVYEFDPTGDDSPGHELSRMWDMIRPDNDRSITPHNTYNTRMETQQPIFWFILDVTLGLCVGLTPYVDNFAHLGGFFFGICVGLSLFWRLGSSGFFGQETLVRHYCHYAYAVIGAVLATCIFTLMRNGVLDW